MALFRTEEDTTGLHSHRDLHSFPTRRSSDLAAIRRFGSSLKYTPQKTIADGFNEVSRGRAGYGVVQNGRGHHWTPLTPRSSLFPYTTLFRSGGDSAFWIEPEIYAAKNNCGCFQ